MAAFRNGQCLSKGIKILWQWSNDTPYFDMLPVFKQVLEKFGSEKLMWGSDCPYQMEGQHSYQAAFEVLAKYADFMSPLDRQNIFQNTAEKVFLNT